MYLGEMCLQVPVSVEAPLTSIALELDIGNLGAVILIFWMQFLKVTLSVELESKDSRTQVTLIGFYLFGRLAAPWRGGIVDVHHQPLWRRTGDLIAMLY